MEFGKLLDITLTHEYYQGLCPDLRFELMPDSSRLLKVGAVKALNTPGQLTLYFQKDNQGDPLQNLAGQQLKLAVTVANPKFSVITNLPKSDNQIPVYRNSTTPSILDAPQSYQKVPGRFSYSLQFSEHPAIVQLTDDDGALVETHTISADSEASDLSLLIEKYGPGFYRIKESADGNNAETLVSYKPSTPLRAIALIELTLDSGFYTTPPSLNIQFSAVNDTLNYYIVASNYSENDFDKLALDDAGFSEQSRGEITFSRMESNNFTNTQVPANLLNSNGAKIVLFHSQSAVSRRQQGPKKLQLKLDGDVLISNLPTPGSKSVKADFFIHVAKP